MLTTTKIVVSRHRPRRSLMTQPAHPPIVAVDMVAAAIAVVLAAGVHRTRHPVPPCSSGPSSVGGARAFPVLAMRGCAPHKYKAVNPRIAGVLLLQGPRGGAYDSPQVIAACVSQDALA